MSDLLDDLENDLPDHKWLDDLGKDFKDLIKDYLNDLLDQLGNRECNVNSTLSQIVGPGGFVDNDMKTLIAGLANQTTFMTHLANKTNSLSSSIDKADKHKLNQIK